MYYSTHPKNTFPGRKSNTTPGSTYAPRSSLELQE